MPGIVDRVFFLQRRDRRGQGFQHYGCRPNKTQANILDEIKCLTTHQNVSEGHNKCDIQDLDHYLKEKASSSMHFVNR